MGIMPCHSHVVIFVLVAGLILLALTSLVFPDCSILYQKANSTRWQGFDVFAFVKESLITPAVLIMAIGYQIAVDSEPGFRVQPSGRSRKLANRRVVEEGARACSFDCAWLFG
jgi:hypothetical protein